MKWRLTLSALFVFALSSASFAYEEDTHFCMTYVLMRLACFSHLEALTIASADQGLDDNDETDPALASAHNRAWHALDDSRQAVLARKDALWTRATSSKSLVNLGQYFHYQQDHWSHRRVKGQNWEPYGPTIGHAVDFHQPDRVPWDRETARQAGKQTLEDAKRYLREVLGRAPVDVKPEIVDRLVDAQCRGYTMDMVGNWNRANPGDVAAQLDAIARQMYLLGDTKKEIRVPTKTQKIPYVFDIGGGVTNGPAVETFTHDIQDYNLGTPINPGPRQPEIPVAPPTTSTTDSGTGSYNGIEWSANVTCSFRLEETTETQGGPIEWCYRTCWGGKHTKHAECDPSCNDNCHMSHGDDVLRAHCDVLPDGVRAAIPEMESGALPPFVWGPAQQKLQQRLAEMVRTYSQDEFRPPFNHFSVFCGCSMRQYGYRKFKLIMTSKVEETRTKSGEADQKTTKTSENVVAYVWQPDGRKPLVQKDYVNCLCDKTATAMIPTKTGGPRVTQPCPGPQAIGTDNPNQIPPIEFNGDGIDECTVPTPPPGITTIRVFIPAGTRLVANNAEYQVLITLADSTVSVPLGSMGLFVAMEIPNQAPQSIPVACAEFSKRPPHGIPYKIAPPSADPLMARLGVAAERQAMKGAWDQERTWIATDHVSLEKMRGRLIPPTPKASYLNALWDLATMCWVDVLNEPYHSLITPDLILDQRCSPGAATWFVGLADRTWPNQLAEVLAKDGPATMAKLDSGTTPYAVALMKGLKNSVDSSLHEVIPKLLDAMPESTRASVMRQVFPPVPNKP